MLHPIYSLMLHVSLSLHQEVPLQIGNLLRETRMKKKIIKEIVLNCFR